MTGSAAEHRPEHVDVLIVGAGISGIGAALLPADATCPDSRTRSSRPAARRRHLGPVPLPRASGRTRTCTPSATSSSRGGTRRRSPTADRSWPTCGRPPRERHRPAHPLPPRSSRADWSSADARWTVDVERADTGERTQLTAQLDLLRAAATTATTRATRPHFEGRERFPGEIVHPQHWPEDLDYAGKRVVVIGSGATAVTLVPAMAEQAAHVTMLQRSPTLRHAAAGEGRRRQRAAQVLGAERALRAHAAEEHRAAAASAVLPARTRSAARQADPLAQREAAARRAIRSTSTSTRPTTRGTSGYAWSRTGTCSRRSASGTAVGGHRPHRHLHRDRGSSSPPVASSMPTSSSPQPG